MAEIISRNNKKKFIKVDLTPMVDLGFLLITFFIVTTSMTEPQAMNYNTPADGMSPVTAESKTLTLVLKAQNKIEYHNGNDSLHPKICGYSGVNGLRNILLQKQHQVEQQFGNKKEMVVLIQPTASCHYKNLVDALDEMLINGITRYMVVPAARSEE